MDYVFSYHWKHIPTGKAGVRTRMFMSYEHYLECLSYWNKAGNGEWVYWR